MSTVSNSGSVMKTLAIGAVMLIVLALVWSIYNLPPEVDRSALGLRGFAIAAKKNDGLNIEFFTGQHKLKAEDYGLRILPLYDPDVRSRKIKPVENKSLGEELLRKISLSVLRNKIKNIPTLVVLPKWRDRVFKKRQVHPDLLIRSGSLNMPYAGTVPFGGREIRRDTKEFVTERLDIHALGSKVGFSKTAEASLYIPQTISDGSLGNPRCKTMVSLDGATLIAECLDQSKFWLLTDPDLINNHGAGNGDNYQIAVELVTFLAEGKPILVDGTSSIFTNEQLFTKARERSFADLVRFFVYPFSLIWFAIIGLSIFTLWHAWRRVGPIIDRLADESIQASKASAIEANVAILRGVDRQGRTDVPLAWTYVTQQMEVLVSDIFGAAQKGGRAGETQLFNALERRNKNLAEQLKSVRSRLSPDGSHGNKRSLFENLRQFELLINEARHEFGRPANPR